MASIRHNVLVRRSLNLVAQIPRALRRWGSGPEQYARQPPILANSFPKSGTHLVLQIAEALPQMRNYGTFVATEPVFPYRRRSPEEHRRIFGRVVPGEVVAGHAFHDPEVGDVLARINAIHLFVFRDLRDVVVSEAHYLTFMNRFHRMHRYFRTRLTTMNERIMTAIRGVTPGGWPHPYPSVAERFRSYAGWLSDPRVTTLRYEDLVGDGRVSALQRIVSRYLVSGGRGDEAQLISRAAQAIRPSESRTFREGKAGGWRSHFTSEHVEAMKEVAGAELVRLGYERDSSW